MFGAKLCDQSLQPTTMQQVPEAREHSPACTMVAERPERTHISQPLTRPQPSVAGAAPEAPLEKELSGELSVLQYVSWFSTFPLGAPVGYSGGQHLGAKVSRSHAASDRCDFSVSLSGTHLSNCLCF